VVEALWIHVGMPKAASTTIQYALSTGLHQSSIRNLPLEAFRKTLAGPEQFRSLLATEWGPHEHSSDYSPLVARCGDAVLLSHENYCNHPPECVAGLDYGGLAVLREPTSWIPSIASQYFLFDYAANPAAQAPIHEVGAIDTDAQLDTLFAQFSRQFHRVLDHIRKWSASGTDFRIVPYTPDLDLNVVLREPLARLGIELALPTSAPVLRVSYNFVAAQLALAIYLAARHRFGRNHATSARLARLALGVDPRVLSRAQTQPQQRTIDSINARVREAHSDYETTLRQAGHADRIAAFVPPQASIIEPEYSDALAETLIRTALQRVRPPDGFDPAAYLDLNPELRGIAAQSGDELAFARDHYEREGAFEGRPASRSV